MTTSSAPIGMTTAGSGGLSAATQQSQLYNPVSNQITAGGAQGGAAHGQQMSTTPQPVAPLPPADRPVFTSATPSTSMEFIPRIFSCQWTRHQIYRFSPSLHFIQSARLVTGTGTVPRLSHSDTIAAVPGTAGGIAVCGNLTMTGCGTHSISN